MSERSQLYWDFWSKFSERLRSLHPTWTRGTSTKSSWFSMSTGIATANWVFIFGSDGLAVQLEFVNSDSAINVLRYEALLSKRDEMESTFGAQLHWDPMEGRKATKIVTRTGIADVSDRSLWDDRIAWFISAGERMRKALESVGGVPSI